VAVASAKDRAKIRRRFAKCPLKCPIYADTVIESLSDFFAVFHSLLDPGKVFWFRGHSKLNYKLSPSALRYLPVRGVMAKPSCHGSIGGKIGFDITRLNQAYSDTVGSHLKRE
jgi:hypothetical protein